MSQLGAVSGIPSDKARFSMDLGVARFAGCLVHMVGFVEADPWSDSSYLERSGSNFGISVLTTQQRFNTSGLV